MNSGHTQSWELGQPGLLAECYEDDQPNGFYGPMDPTKESTFTFLSAFFDETSLVFPDEYFHVGGDEVYTDCWLDMLLSYLTSASFPQIYPAACKYLASKLYTMLS
jgi:N-acetyl-beta-hexosaminidase